MTCLLVTRNRRHWLPYALQCARYQTYRPREILVVSSGESVADLLEPGERNVHVDGHPTIGTARNVGCRAASGSVVAHFDDDDFSHPSRLEEQVLRLIESGKSVTGYRSMRFTDGTRSWMYTGAPEYALGTSLVYQIDFWKAHPFPGVQVGEDNSFVGAARAHGSIISCDAGAMQWATVHPKNTSPRQLRGSNWREIHET